MEAAGVVEVVHGVCMVNRLAHPDNLHHHGYDLPCHRRRAVITVMVGQIQRIVPVNTVGADRTVKWKRTGAARPPARLYSAPHELVQGLVH